MKEKITLCGDNCLECPRYSAHIDEELKAVAELWYKAGWRDRVVSNEEIVCSGCSLHKQCTKCKEVCSEQEYIILKKTFFEKENNLKK